MAIMASIPCGNCGSPVTGLASGLRQRRISNISGMVYCSKCKDHYGGRKKAICADCGTNFSFRMATAIIGGNFRPSPRRCPACVVAHEASKALRCHWCGTVATCRAGELIPGKNIGACSKAECHLNLVQLMAGGADRWALLVKAEVGEETAGFIDPYYDLADLSWGRKESTRV